VYFQKKGETKPLVSVWPPLQALSFAIYEDQDENGVEEEEKKPKQGVTGGNEPHLI